MVACSFLLATGCKTFEVGLDKPTQKTVQQSTDDLKKSAALLKETGDSIQKGLEALDPLGTKTLLNENADLRKKIDAFNTLIEKINQNDNFTITLGSEQLLVRIHQYLGSVTVRAVLDDRPQNDPAFIASVSAVKPAFDADKK